MNNSSPIVVTGGTGTVGHHVVDRLRDAERRVRVVSRHDRSGDTRTGLEWAVADLGRDEGIERALAGADTVVHCATGYSRRADVRAARHLFSAARVAGIEHVVLISIVGVDRIPFGYYTGKVEVEQQLERSGLGYSILRSTQFHELVAGLFARQQAPTRSSHTGYPDPADRRSRSCRRTCPTGSGPTRGSGTGGRGARNHRRTRSCPDLHCVDRGKKGDLADPSPRARVCGVSRRKQPDPGAGGRSADLQRVSGIARPRASTAQSCTPSAHQPSNSRSAYAIRPSVFPGG